MFPAADHALQYAAADIRRFGVEKIMGPQELHVVTGAFGYSGKYIAARLLARGHRVRTLTNSGTRGNSFGGKVEVHPLAFDRPQTLTDSLRGASVLYNTY